MTAIALRTQRVGRQERSLLRQLARRRASALGMTKAEWERKRRSEVTPFAADMLMCLWTPGRTITGELVPHPFAA